jgi:hypothetical protein
MKMYRFSMHQVLETLSMGDGQCPIGNSGKVPTLILTDGSIQSLEIDMLTLLVLLFIYEEIFEDYSLQVDVSTLAVHASHVSKTNGMGPGHLAMPSSRPLQSWKRK